MDHSPIRVLQVVPSLNKSAGVANVVYNWNLFHDEQRVHFDYLHHSMRNGVLMHANRYDEELKAGGSKVFTVNYASDNFGKFTKGVHQLLQEIGGDYDIIHCHMPNSAFVILKDAQKAGIQHRILHSHLNSSSDKFLHRLRNAPLNAIGEHYTTDRIACSEEAGKYLFKNKPFLMLNNGIPLERFAFDAAGRESVRTELGIDKDALVIGCIGRFVKQKNLPFAIHMFVEFHKAEPNSRLLLVGDGVERAAIEQLVVSEGLTDSALLLGVREDMDKVYSAMDTLFMPSLYEGLPVAAVEAQAAGLPCVYATGVPAETDITDTGTFIPLSEDSGVWVKALRKATTTKRLLGNPSKLEEHGYSAKANAELLMQHYEMLIARNE